MDILSVRNQIKREGINFKDLPLRVAFYARVSTDFMEQLNSLKIKSSISRSISAICRTGNSQAATSTRVFQV